MVRGSSERYGQAGTGRDKLVPEGVEGQVPYKGSLSDFVYQLVGGIKAGLGYCGCADLAALREKGRFLRISGAGLTESHPHDVFITKETTNYRRSE
jgi:IMP dehydrogenase